MTLAQVGGRAPTRTLAGFGSARPALDRGERPMQGSFLSHNRSSNTSVRLRHARIACRARAAQQSKCVRPYALRALPFALFTPCPWRTVDSSGTRPAPPESGDRVTCERVKEQSPVI